MKTLVVALGALLLVALARPVAAQQVIIINQMGGYGPSYAAPPYPYSAYGYPAYPYYPYPLPPAPSLGFGRGGIYGHVFVGRGEGVVGYTFPGRYDR